MKVLGIRQSGRPFKLEEYDAYDAEYKERYDEILEECGTDMQAVHGTLEMLDEELAGKYDTICKFDFPNTVKGIKNFVNEYGNYMTSVHRDTGELVIIIMDMEGM